MAKTIVLGIGNVLLSDEGVGIRALDFIRTQWGEDAAVEYVDGGTLSFTLVGTIADADRLLVIDAANLNAAPGTVQLFRNAAMDTYVSTGGKRSVHEVGLSDLMSMARLTDELPAERALIGIQPLKLDWGDDLSPPVAEAMGEVRRHAVNLLQEWR